MPILIGSRFMNRKTLISFFKILFFVIFQFLYIKSFANFSNFLQSFLFFFKSRHQNFALILSLYFFVEKLFLFYLIIGLPCFQFEGDHLFMILFFFLEFCVDLLPPLLFSLLYFLLTLFLKPLFFFHSTFLKFLYINIVTFIHNISLFDYFIHKIFVLFFRQNIRRFVKGRLVEIFVSLACTFGM